MNGNRVMIMLKERSHGSPHLISSELNWTQLEACPAQFSSIQKRRDEIVRSEHSLTYMVSLYPALQYTAIAKRCCRPSQTVWTWAFEHCRWTEVYRSTAVSATSRWTSSTGRHSIHSTNHICVRFLADRTIGRAYGTVCRLSSSVCLWRFVLWQNGAS